MNTNFNIQIYVTWHLNIFNADINIGTNLDNDIVECLSDTPPTTEADIEASVVDLTNSDSEEDDVPLSVLAQSMRKSEQTIVNVDTPREVSRTSSTDSEVMVVE